LTQIINQELRRRMEVNIEVGISVSVESSPRVTGWNTQVPGAPTKNMELINRNRTITIQDSSDDDDDDDDRMEVDVDVDDGDRMEVDEDVDVDCESVSPRPKSITRRLSFSISPIPFAERSVSVEYLGRTDATTTWSVASRSSTTTAATATATETVTATVTATGTPAGTVVVIPDPDPMMIGECAVCYALLPERANHVFTLCGHLFCVKCFLTWWDTSSTCPMCRAQLFVADATENAMADSPDDTIHVVEVGGGGDGDGGGDDDESGSGDESADESGDNDDVDESGDNDDVDESGDEMMDVEERNPAHRQHPTNEVPHGTTAIDRYLHLDSGIQWSNAPDMDDDIIELTTHEIEVLRENREIATLLFTRQQFAERLFSPNDTNGDIMNAVFYTWIPKQHWVGLSSNNMGPSNRYEFVTRRMSDHSNYETNMFGYIQRIVIMNTDNIWQQRISVGGDGNDDDDWENRHEYAFIADVFAPSGPSYRYNLDDGTFETREIILTFSDIRRMYLIR